MNFDLKPRQGEIATIILSLLLLFSLYSKVLLSPNSHFFSNEVDGTSNYFSYAFHVKHGTSFSSFDGMNYPYGEYIHYVDCHPLLANVFRVVDQNLFGISNYSIGILNLLMLLSIVLCSYFIYKILRHFKVFVIGSVLAAVGISFLASQVLLWKYGHYALSYSFFFPMSWFLLIRYFENISSYRLSIFICLNTLIWFYTHNYLGFIVLTFGATSFIYIYFLGDLEKRSGMLYHFIIQSILPVFIVLINREIYDVHEGRFDWPFTMDFTSSMWTIIYPAHTFLQTPIDSFLGFFNSSAPKDEPWILVGTYIGASTIILLLMYFFKNIRGFQQWTNNSLKVRFKGPLSAYIIASLLLLIYSMGIPFGYAFDSLLDYIPLLKQFIGLGRFAWAFYFVISIFALVYISRQFQNTSAKLIIVFASLLTIAEAVSVHNSVANNIKQNKNLFSADNAGNGIINNDVAKIDWERYQAIIPLPFFSKWNTPFDYPGTAKSEELAMRISYYSGVPLMASFLARPSIDEGEKILQIFSPIRTLREIEMDLPNGKPFLVLWTREIINTLESQLISRCRVLIELEDFVIYEITKNSIFDFGKKELMLEFDNAVNNLQYDTITGFYHPPDIRGSYHNDFEQNETPVAFRGTGCLALEIDQDNLLFQGEPGSLELGTTYVISFWYYNKHNKYYSCNMWVDEVNPENEVVSSFQFLPSKSILYQDGWALNEFFFQISDTRNTIFLRSKGTAEISSTIYVDEILVRPKDVDLYRLIQRDNEILYIRNNLDAMRLKL